MFQPNPDVLVAGAGPVGAFAALSLARRGLTVKIADAGWQPGMHSYALALHPASLGLFDEAGLFGSVMMNAYPVYKIGIYDESHRRAELNIGDGTKESPGLAVLRQDVIEELLEAALGDAGVPVSWSERVSRCIPAGDHVEANVDVLEKESRGYAVARTEWVVAGSTALKPRYVLGCDGHNSWVRRMLRLAFPEVAPAQHFAVFEFHTDADLGNEMRLVFANGTTNVLWPLPEGFCRWSFELPGYGSCDAHREKDRAAVQVQTGDYPILNERRLAEFLKERAHWFQGSIGEITWKIVVRFERRLANEFGRDRIWLAGDAAHLTGPAGVQSMNAGLAEAAELARAIAGADSEALAAYGANSLENWNRLLDINKGLRASATADPFVAKHAHALLPCLPAVGPDLVRMAELLGLEFAAGAAAAG